MWHKTKWELLDTPQKNGMVLCVYDDRITNNTSLTQNGQFQTQFNKAESEGESERESGKFVSMCAHLKIDCTYMMYGHFLANYGSFVGSISFAFVQVCW